MSKVKQSATSENHMFLHVHLVKQGDLMPEEQIGLISNFFSKISVAAIQITAGELKVGDTIKIKGSTTDLTQTIDSMEIEKVKVPSATAGKSVGIKVKDRCRPGDAVYKVTP
jgi:translation initiation factor IF-2